ncbi:MAG: DUF3857 domain-containing transglutaminase family protein [Verrucomicrobiia bacterium]
MKANSARRAVPIRSFRPLVLEGILAGVALAAIPCTRAEQAPAPESKPVVAAPAKWVAPVFFQRLDGSVALTPGENQHCLLAERQLNAGENDVFIHRANQILTISGVEKGSTISIDYQPSYQSLTFHWVNIWRGTNVLKRLDVEKIRLIQPERELDQAVYSGTKSAVLILEDVRVGDIVDYACSIRGANPVLAGKFFATVPVQLDQPVEHMITRVVFPNQRQLYARNHHCTVTPSVTRVNDSIEYKWDLRGVPGVKEEDSLPAWYTSEAWVQLSEFKSWAEVNQWAMGLFRNTSALTPELRQKIAQWQQVDSREDQILAALQFVQDEVRYFGIEIGANSQQPTSPAVVFSRRFGDCKDKALLFVTILRTMGIEAYPVLVNTECCGTLAEWTPSAVAFDHAIAVALVDGRAYWLDPTDRYQRGPLAAHYLPAYGLGLVIQPNTTGLTAIPHTTGMPQTRISEYYVVRGLTAPADLKVVTAAEGLDAERLREQFATTPRDQIEKSYLTFYSKVYSGITQARPLVLHDDEQLNRVEITEFYTIDKMWVPSDQAKSSSCEFYPYSIGSLLKTPVDRARNMPLSVPFPQHQIVRTEVTLPEPWPAKTDSKFVSDPAFSLQMNLNQSGNLLVMDYEYQSYADCVPADRAGTYVQKLTEASQALGTSLSWKW